jgi:hypothetical protein
MPTVLYKWDFETGDTQGWVLGSYSSLDSTSKLQGTYCLKYDKQAGGTHDDIVAYIEGIDLSTANRPMMVFIVRVDLVQRNIAKVSVGVEVLQAGSVLQSTYMQLLYPYVSTVGEVTRRFIAVKLNVAGKSDLTIRIRIRWEGTEYYSDISRINVFIDQIHIIDGGDREYDIAVLALNNIDRTITYSIPEAERALPSGVARFSVILATPPHPLSEGSDIFTYTAVTDQGTASITSTDSSYKHTSSIVTPSTAPSYINELRIRVYPKTAGTEYYAYDETVVVTFWSIAWDLLAVYVFHVAITINPYSPVYQTAMINIQYGGVWSGYRDFDVKVHARSLGIRCYARFVYGDYTVVQTATVRLEVYSEDYSTKYGESVADLTTGSEARGSTITGLPVDTTLKLRISWTITASARVVIEVRPEFIVY